MRRSGRSYLLAYLGVFAAYAVSGKLGLQLATLNANTTAVWPPAGIALAALILVGPRIWPAIFAGAFAVNVLTSGDSYASLLIAIGETLESCLAAYLIVRFARGRHAFLRCATVARFAAIALAVPAINATTGVTTLVLTGHGAPDYVLPVWATWWTGEATGALIVAPLILAWATRPSRIRRGRGPDPLHIALRAAATFVASLSVVAVWAMAEGTLPFMSAEPLYSVAVLQSVLAAGSLALLALAATLLRRHPNSRLQTLRWAEHPAA